MTVRERLTNLDRPLLLSAVVLPLIGLAAVYGAAYDPAAGRVGAVFHRQVVDVAMGIAALAVCAAVDYRKLVARAWFLYGGLVVMLAWAMSLQGVRLFDPGDLVPAQQLSELGCVVLILVLARLYGRADGGGHKARVWMAAFAAVAFLCLLALASGRVAGPAFVLAAVGVAVTVFAGLRARVVAVVALSAVVAGVLFWQHGLTDYQRERIWTAVDPERDPRGAGYMAMQARMTVGSGGLAGGDVQSDLPFADDAFIFATIAGDYGFLGVTLVLGLYVFVILRSLAAAKAARDDAGAGLAAGVAVAVALQVLGNVAVSSGLLAVWWGVRLPLLSAGGSVAATLAGLGLVLNVGMNRKDPPAEAAEGVSPRARGLVAGLQGCFALLFALVLAWCWRLQIGW